MSEENGDNANGKRREAVMQVIKDALGAGESVGSKLSGMGVILGAIWLIMEVQTGFYEQEFERIHNEIKSAKVVIEETSNIRRERLEHQMQRSDTDTRHELQDLRSEIQKNSDDCEKRFMRVEAALGMRQMGE